MASGTVRIDFESLTFNELVEFEDITGESSSRIGETLSAKAMRALVWIVMKRDNPDITIEEAGLLKVAAFSAAAEETRSDPPTPLAPLDRPRRASKKAS